MVLSLTKRVRNIARFRDIMAVLAAYGFDELVDQLDLEERAVVKKMIRPRSGSERRTRWQRVAEALQELGPTFVKLGQILSTRGDLLPEEAIPELKRLQAQVKPEPFDSIRAMVETALGAPVDEVFAELETVPVAAASMAQVHRARLRDGRDVALKVLRPGIREVVENDIDILWLIGALAERVPEIRVLQPRGLVREFERAMLNELDLGHELANIRRFRQNFRGDDSVVIPQPIEELCSRNVLTMEFLRGVPFSEYQSVGADRRTIATRAIGAIFKMAFQDGFFHSDPHPGNVLVLPGDRIGLLDMGQAGRLDRALRDKVVLLMSALVREDPERIAEAVLSLGEVHGTAVDFGSFRKDVVDLYEAEVRGKAIKDLQFGRVMGQLTRVAATHHIQIPSDLGLVLKTLVTMEGVAKEVYPELDVMEEAAPYVRRLMLERYSPERLSADLVDTIQVALPLAQALPRRLDRLLTDLEQGRLVVRVEDADPKATRGMRERIAARNALGMGGGGLAVAGALLLVAGHPNLSIITFATAIPLLLWTALAAIRPRSG